MLSTNKQEISVSTKVEMELYSFGENHFEKHLITDPADLVPFIERKEVKFWLNVPSVDDKELILSIAEIFNIHSLIIEDICDTDQRPKIEEFDDHVFVVLKMLYSKNSVQEIQIEQVSILFGSNYILSFQETPLDILDSVRIRMENPKGKMRKLGPDYFAYVLVDTIVDEYFTVLELISEVIEKCEDKIINNKSEVTLNEIHDHRKSLRKIRANTWPIREVMTSWKKSEHPLIKRKNLNFVNDVYEHSIQIMEGIELQRETLSNLAELYMTQLSNKQNEVMKTLTVIATIFIPLTFIAGIYGMNFKVMPELDWKYGYLGVWGIFIAITGIMIHYFKRKKWF